MLRSILTSIVAVFFVMAGLVIAITGNAETRRGGLASVLFFGVLGSLAFLGILRRQSRRANQESRQAMTREQMLASIEQMHGQLQCLSPFYFDIRGPGMPSGVLLDEWVQRRKPEQFEAFLEIIAHPPPSPNESWQEQWPDSMAQMLAAWVARDPDRLFPALWPTAAAKAARPVFLQTFADLAGRASVGGVPERREQMALWLTPWQEQTETLSEMERDWLDEAATFCAPAC